jgi:hypothetical protein
MDGGRGYTWEQMIEVSLYYDTDHVMRSLCISLLHYQEVQHAEGLEHS